MHALPLPLSTKNQRAAAVSHKTCSRCGLRKGAAEFNYNKVSPDGLCSYCKPCNAAAAAERRKRRVPVPEPTVVDKTCSHCKEVRLVLHTPRNDACALGTTPMHQMLPQLSGCHV